MVAAPVADAGDKPINFSCSILGFERVLPGSEIKVPTTTCINSHREGDIHVSLLNSKHKMQFESGLFSRKHHLLHVNRKQVVLPEDQGKGSSLKNANTTLASNHKQIELVLVSPRLQKD